MITAGTVLPLALAHRWGRVWPSWIRSWAGRDVPHWLVLGPGVFMGVGLCAYFGVGGSLALLVVSTSYYRLTKPSCPVAPATTGTPAGRR